MFINGTNESETKGQLQSAIERVAYGGLQSNAQANNNPTTNTTTNSPSNEQKDQPTSFGLIIDGEALKYALRSQNEELFLQLCMQCTSVICCRSSPLQKALVVRMVKRKLKCMCLAIGDGENSWTLYNPHYPSKHTL
jgi:magnesium-transporting ATPase (P-type)